MSVKEKNNLVGHGLLTNHIGDLHRIHDNTGLLVTVGEKRSIGNLIGRLPPPTDEWRHLLTQAKVCSCRGIKTIVSTVSAAVTMALKTVTGKICDTEFAGRRNVLVYAVNAIGCDAFGLVKDLHQVYRHEGAYSRRKRLYNLSRAMVSSRDEPGTLIVQEPLGMDKSPTLIACVTQFGWGASIEDNVKAMQATNTSHDWHYVEGLKEDTKTNRRHHFKTCMKKLATLVMGHKDVEKLIIPEGMGCRRKLDEEWREYYLPAIEALATRLQPFGIQTALVCAPE